MSDKNEQNERWRELDLFKENIELRFSELRRDMTDDIKEIHKKLDAGLKTNRKESSSNLLTLQKRLFGVVGGIGAASIGVLIFILERMFVMVEIETRNEVNIENLSRQVCALMGC